MREPENCKLTYCGFERPQTGEEIDFEILGLEALVKKAEEKIASLKQTKFLADIALRKNVSSLREIFVEEK